MIRTEKLKDLRNWFNSYVSGFYNKDIKFNQIIKLKQEHCIRVSLEIKEIGKYCDLHQKQYRLAETIALLHDLGRFEQYKKYGTFSDRKSENHAELSVKLLKQYNLLDDIDEITRNIIFTAIKNHNKREIPYHVFGDELFYSKLLRDADKIDVFKVVTDYYENKLDNSGGAIELELPDLPDIIEQNFLDIESCKLIKIENLRTLNDFKLMQISWLFDINFNRTLELIHERNYIDKIFNTLPQDEKVVKARENVMEYLLEATVKHS